MNKLKGHRLHIVMSAGCIFMTTACTDPANSVSLRGYNHMKVLAINTFTVNGAVGPNVDTESGGGGTCCVNIPKRWKPGLKAKVSWSYDQNADVKSPLPVSQTAEVEIPEYQFIGAVHVHFYEDHKVKIIVSSCSPEHPFYPMNAADLAPWQPAGTRDEWREAAQRGGGSIDC